MDNEGLAIYLYDYRNQLVGIMPEAIEAIYPTSKENQCLIIFSHGLGTRLFNHSIYEIVNALDTFYNGKL